MHASPAAVVPCNARLRSTAPALTVPRASTSVLRFEELSNTLAACKAP